MASCEETSLAVLRPRIGRRLVPLVHAVVAQHGGDAQPVVAQDAAAARRLSLAMMFLVAPGLYRRLVAPEREREQLGVVGQALESLDADEAVDPLERRLQPG